VSWRQTNPSKYGKNYHSWFAFSAFYEEPKYQGTYGSSKAGRRMVHIMRSHALRGVSRIPTLALLSLQPDIGLQG